MKKPLILTKQLFIKWIKIDAARFHGSTSTLNRLPYSSTRNSTNNSSSIGGDGGGSTYLNYGGGSIDENVMLRPLSRKGILSSEPKL